MTDEEFNKKWSHCLPDGRPGAHIGIPEVLIIWMRLLSRNSVEP
jgi:hypothetical protein